MEEWTRQLRDELNRLEADGLLRGLRAVEPRDRPLAASRDRLVTPSRGAPPSTSRGAGVDCDLRDANDGNPREGWFGGAREAASGGDSHCITVAGRTLINLASNDYLALSRHPRLAEAAIDAVKRFGAGSGASRLVSGHRSIHAEVEQRFAQFKHAEAALLFPTGYMANLAAVTSLAGPGDTICLDKLCHASLIDAARLSGATVRVFPHRNYDKLERLLQRVGVRDGATRPPRTLILTDSIFSMDGDAADLPRLCDLTERHNAILIVDEAHATGLLGETGAGLCEMMGVAERVPVVVSTASKALGSLGGVVTGRQVVIDTLINRGRSFIYTTAVPPSQVAAIGAARDVVRDEPWRRHRLAELSTRLRDRLNLPPADPPTPIIPLITGGPGTAVTLSQKLEHAGYFAPAIRPPTVPADAERVRISLHAKLTEEEIDRLAEVLCA